MVKHEACDLCGLDITSAPVVKVFDGEEKHFCCQGCARVYQAAYENEMLDQVLGPSSRPKIKSEAGPGESAHFSIQGMWCAGCAVAAENVLKKMPGVQTVDVSFAAELGRIQFDPKIAQPQEILQTLDTLGYQAHLTDDTAEKETTRQQERTLLQLITAAAFGMQIMLLYLVQLYPRYAAGQFNLPVVRELQYLTWALATPVLFYGGSSFLRGGWRALRAGTATMDTLVSLGTLSAYGYSVYVTVTGNAEAYYDSVAMITTFIMLGRYLEAIGGAQARKDIRHLLNLQPEEAWKSVNGTWEQVKAGTLTPGDTILVKPGERVPLDGEIAKGAAAFNEAVLTGESMPVDKATGDPVFAGTLALDAPVEIRVSEDIGASRLAQITKIVEETISQKPPIQRLADKASAYFAFGILGIAILTLGGWLLTGVGLGKALLAGVSVLVVACPCALGLATPLAITVTLGKITQKGLLVRNLDALETAAKVRRMVFDKTGTLTRGEMRVEQIQCVRGSAIHTEELLQITASAEQYSEHPIAATILKANRQPLLPVENFVIERGAGIQAEVHGEHHFTVKIGSLRYIGTQPDANLLEQAEACSAKGETVIWVGWEEKIRGFLTLQDEPKPTAQAVLQSLKDMGIIPVMLSGDAAATTKAIAESLGLTEFEGNCPPEAKAERIKGWQEAGEVVAMVGDGVNDAPALAQADLSFTVMGGTAVAGETSDILLMHADLELIPELITTSRHTHRVILQNLGWAFAYNMVSVPLASLGVISPVIAAITMATSSLLVVGNSLRLRGR
ncbi:heavy metal translocating P-type ATPase [bacterium]|nr:heavy metal translocating P-type ATPase [bacterium]